MLSLYGTSLFTSCGVSIIKTLDPTLPPVSGDRDSVKQILLNIWKNAAEVMQAGGHIGITTAPTVVKNSRNFVEIVLSDSGPGLPKDVQDNLFKPLEQYRRPGHSGIGLSIVATLVKNLKGHITCQSVPGLGTTFTILLPHRNGNN
jgi:nitrogen-specific signal transduction histidine kinase